MNDLERKAVWFLTAAIPAALGVLAEAATKGSITGLTIAIAALAALAAGLAAYKALLAEPPG